MLARCRCWRSGRLNARPSDNGAGATETIRVLIVDDHADVRSSLRALLEVPGIEVCGEAENGADAVQRAMELRPDVVLMDVRMPDMDGLAATRIIKRQTPDVAVVIITSFESQEYLREAIEAGAAGYLLKGMSRDLLLSTLNSASDGGSMIDATMLRELVQRSPKPGSPTGILDTLGEREYETLHLVARGLTNREIAAQLGYSVGTIKNVVQQLIEKLGVSDRTQAAVVAVREGMEVD